MLQSAGGGLKRLDCECSRSSNDPCSPGRHALRGPGVHYNTNAIADHGRYPMRLSNNCYLTLLRFLDGFLYLSPCTCADEAAMKQAQLDKLSILALLSSSLDVFLSRSFWQMRRPSRRQSATSCWRRTRTSWAPTPLAPTWLWAASPRYACFERVLGFKMCRRPCHARPCQQSAPRAPLPASLHTRGFCWRMLLISAITTSQVPRVTGCYCHRFCH